MSDEYTLPVNDDIYITGEIEEVAPEFSEIDDDDSTQETVTRTPANISSDNRSSIGSGELKPSPSDVVPADVTTSEVIVTQRVRHQIDDYEPAALKALSDAGAVFYGVYADGHEEGPIPWTDVYDLDPEGTIIELDEEIASAIAQNFWADTQGVHITDDPYDKWIEAYEANPQFPNLSTTKNYYNILLNAGGALLRRALNNLVSINRTAISFYDGLGNASTNIMAFFGRNGAQIGRSDEKHVVINSSGIGSYNGDGTVADFTMRGSSIVNSTISGSALVDNTITGGKIANATITGSKIDSGTITNANIQDGTITGAKIDAGTITNANIQDGTIQGSKIQGSTLTDIPFAAITDAEVEVANIADAQISNATITEAQVENLTTNYAHLQNGVIDNATIDHADVNGLNTTYATISNLNTATARIDELEADHVSVDDFEAEQANIDSLQAATADIATIRADSAKVHSLTAAQLSAATGYVGSLTAGNVSAQDIVADHATIGALDTTYAQINMANVNNAWINNGVIKDGAISSAMINDVSANKLTAGTINGSVINVTNLNADNITTGTINGQRIGEGSLSLSKLEDDVYTEAEVDAKLSTMQSQIDGAIETWTGTAVPTLQNAPASSWNTTALKDSHVGDVYFVVNSQSQQNGYNYRFTKSGSTYSWQLIKDSDVTNALQRITTAEGKITTFDSDISQLKTDTGTLTTKTTSLETRMSDAEADILDKVDTTTFNEVSDTVDSHSQSITQMTTTLSNKADSSTVSAVTQRVSKNEQDISGINTTIGELQTTVESKADSSTVETISTKLNTVSDTVDGHTQSISSITSTQTTMQGKLDKTLVETTQLWFSKADTTAPNKPTTQVTSTTTTGNAWTTVVPVYNASYPNYYYCYQWKYSDGTYGWSSVTRDIATGEMQATARQAQNDIDNLEIGGRNLLPSSIFTDKGITGSTKELGPVSLNTMYSYFGNNDRYIFGTFEENTQYTFRVGAIQSAVDNTWVGHSGPHFKFRYTDGTEDDYTNRITFFYKDEAELVYKALVSNPTKSVLNICVAYGHSHSNWCFYDMKLEKGNKATDWTPAPEDVDAAIDKVDSKTSVRLHLRRDNWTDSQWGAYCSIGHTENFNNLHYASGGATSATGFDATTLNIGDLIVIEGMSTGTNIPYSATAKVTSVPTSATGDIPATVISANNAKAIESRISSAETSISQTNNQIALKANSSDVYTKTQTDGLISTEVSNRNSAIEQSANAINLSVSQNYTTKTEFNALEVGGRNRLINTENPTSQKPVKGSSCADPGILAGTVTYADGIGTYTVTYTGTTERYIRFVPSNTSDNLSLMELPSPGEFVFSGYVKTNLKNSTYLNVRMQGGASGWTNPTIENLVTGDITTDSYLPIVSGISDWTYFAAKVTFTVEVHHFFLSFQLRTTDGTVSIPIGDALAVGDTFEFKKLKFERGTKATDWSPAPEDIESRVEAAEASIAINADNIESKVSKDGVISSINQSAESVTINANRVNIEGATIFSSGRLSTTSLNNTYDAKGAASTAESNAKAAIPTDLSDLNNDSGFITNADVPTKVSDLTNDSGFQTSSEVSAAVTNGVSGKADKANAVKRTQRIWYRSNSATAPSTPGTASANWVTKADDGNAAWTKMHVAISSTHKYVYTCEQYELASGTVGYTMVLRDNTITVIDGGNIITGTVSANAVNASSGTFDTANIPDLSAAKITSGDISAARIKANVISAINSLTAGQIDADRINASQLSIGQSQVTDLTSDLADAKKHTQVIISATNVNYVANTCTLTARLYIDGVLQTSTSLKWQWYRDGTTQGSQTTGATGSLAVTSSLGLAHRYGCKCTF